MKTHLDVRAQAGIIEQRLTRYYGLASKPTQDAIACGYITFKLSNVVPRARRALENIKRGTYGICEDCEDDIKAERLIAVPAATKCLTCQDIEERLTRRLNKRKRTR